VEATTALCIASAPALRPIFFRTSYIGRGTVNSNSVKLGSISSPPLNTPEISNKRGYKDLKALPPLPQDEDDEERDPEIDILQMLRSPPPARRYPNSGSESDKKLTVVEEESVSEGPRTPV
jgi:hypothetical protein